ncbi:MAG: tRNA lysidine(34) synthetase TilS, partial [Halanaerobiales bacterium]
MSLYDNFISYVNKESLVSEGDIILLAVSGGPDSLALFDLFCRAREEMGVELAVFHLNHCLRQEAEEEAGFVASLCNEAGIQAFVKEYDVGDFTRREGLSVEEGARKVRFRMMSRLVEEHLIDKVALGHNKNDLVETVFFNLIRGTGLKGLRGIDPRSRWHEMELIHPLLSFSRREIQDYCRSRNLNPRRDSSN